uniref:Polynucleotidyl transferase, Ribonuclease H fold n=1 Tax=Medicago truncatula TaxID=3880 RepID=Q2HTL1_MEDTR|nr:Polynucleotidyl transferase, Ribonuclease H fold [Medicago truncatula]
MNAQTMYNHAPRQSNTQGVLQWKKPSLGRYKSNVDASFSHALGRVGIGMCIQDEHGRFVMAKTKW